jgi:hypothetical protein
VYTGAKSRAAKIKSQHGDAESIKGFRRLVNHFVVHRAAKKRMRMADNRGERRIRGCGWGPENRFEASGRTFQEEIAGFVCADHRRAMDKLKFSASKEKDRMRLAIPGSSIPRGKH